MYKVYLNSDVVAYFMLNPLVTFWMRKKWIYQKNKIERMITMKNSTKKIVIPIDGSETALGSLEYLDTLYGPKHNL